MNKLRTTGRFLAIAGIVISILSVWMSVAVSHIDFDSMTLEKLIKLLENQHLFLKCMTLVLFLSSVNLFLWSWLKPNKIGNN